MFDHWCEGIAVLRAAHRAADGRRCPHELPWPTTPSRTSPKAHVFIVDDRQPCHCNTQWTWRARREDEPLGHPRDPQGHRAARHHQLCRRPALAQDLPGRASSRDACDKVLREDGQAALQYAASEGYGPLREMVAAVLPWKVDPAQVLITTGSQQGLDLVAKVLIDAGSAHPGGDAHLPGRAAGLHADGAGSRAAWPATTKAWTWTTWPPRPAGRALPLPAAQLPEPDRPHHERGAPRRAVAPRRRAGPAPRRRQPLRRPVVRRAAAAAADRAQPGRLHLPGLVLQGAGARPAPGLPGRAASRCTPSCCRPSRRPTCTARASTSAWWPR